jgi:hypothetical protein
MTDQDKKRIFEYCGWRYTDFKPIQAVNDIDHPLNGNDIREVVKIMEKRGELQAFEYFASDKWNEINPKERAFSYTLQNFFSLMAQWLEVKGK